MSNSSSPGPMYGAPQTPTPVPVPQAIAEESVVTSCYAQESSQPPPQPPNRVYEQPQPVSQQNHHVNYQQQGHYSAPPQQGHPHQQHHGGYQQTPLYHQQGPQYHNPNPGPVAVVQFTSQHPQPQPQQQQHYQVHHLQPHQQQHPNPPPHHNNHHYQHQQHNMNHQQQHHQMKQGSPQPQQQHYSQPQPQPSGQHVQQHHQMTNAHVAPKPNEVGPSQSPRPQEGTMAPPQPQPSPQPQQPQQMMNPRPQQQYYNLAPAQQQPGGQPRLQPQIRQWPTVRQPVQSGPVVVKAGPPGVQQPQKQIQVPQVISGQPGMPQQARPIVIRGQHPGGQVGQNQYIIRQNPGQVRPGVRQVYRVVTPGQGQQLQGAVQLKPGGHVQFPVQQGQVRQVHVRPGSIQHQQRPIGSPVRMGVIQPTDQGHQYQPQQPRYGQPMVVQQNQWRQAGQPPHPQHRQMVQPQPHQRQPGVIPVQQVHIQKPVQRFVQQGPPDNGQEIAYNVEHVFMENGKEVRKMPVLINGETVWVECVNNVQNGGDIEGDMIEMDISNSGQQPMNKPGATNQTSASQNQAQNTKNLTQEQKNQIINECVEDHFSPADVAKKWGCNPDTIRTWIRKAGKTLPKTYKKSAFSDSGVSGNAINHHNITEEQKQSIMREVLEEHISPNELARKYSIPAYAIRDWIKKAGHTLPKSYKRTLKSGNNVQLPTTPLPPGQVGVSVGDPPSIDSPPALEVSAGSLMSNVGSSPAGSTTSNSSYQQTPSKRIPGKLALCKQCGTQSDDLAVCIRCKRKFPEDVKLLDDPAFRPKPDSTDSTAKKSSALRGVRPPNKNRKRNNDEPVCIALSDSEEDGEDDFGDPETIDESSEDGVVADANIIDGSVPGSWCSLTCRSIRIGNYKVLPKEKITITEKGVQIKVPAILNPNEVVTINIVMKDILKVLAHFGKQMPLLFLYISPTACQKTRKLLKMTNSQSFYLEVTSADETQKRITILPDKLNEDSKVILKQHFSGNLQLQELESKDANEILVRSSPKDIAKMKEKMTGAMAMQSQEKTTPPGQVVKYCQYPPDMAGNVSVTNEDFNCLEAEQFLNDVIIDFYLKYLQHGKFTNIKEVMDKTHIFTTYFYKRLTTRPQKLKGKPHPVEDNPSLSAAEKRYDRVERWTKKVNLFEKDFIVVPINEHAHWFVCVICFPGQLGCVNAQTGDACETPVSQTRSRGSKMKRKNVKKPMTIGSTTITRVGSGRDDIKLLENDDGSDRDEAEASDDDIEEDEEENGVKKVEDQIANALAIRQPCILTFDSLAGSSKARTHQTLREYLSCEWRKKMVSQGREERVFNKDTMPGGSPKVQQQPNFSDCGIYLLQYVESFFKDPIKDYTLPIKTLGEWFTKDEVENKRNSIAELIKQLAAQQNPSKQFDFPQLNFFNPTEDDSEEDDEDDEDGMRGPRSSNVQINGQYVRVNGPVVMTPSKGKVLIQKTGNQFKMSPYTSNVPAGVTVTPAPGPPIRQLSANNISIRKMSSVVTSDSVQTSPDSTSQETDLDGSGDTRGQSDTSLTGSESSGGGADTSTGSGVKRQQENTINGCDGVKRIKSDSES